MSSDSDSDATVSQLDVPMLSMSQGSATSGSSAHRHRQEWLQVLEKHWGYRTFRAGQRQAVSACMGGRDVFVLMATGSGKSICYQLPVMVHRSRGNIMMTVVVSPLVSLMEDQVMALRARGVEACHLAAGTPGGVVADAFQGKFSLVYMTPERAEGSIEQLQQLHERDMLLSIAVDESHCVSHWGHDFRPAFRNLIALRRALPKVPIIALTATATPRVQADIVMQLGLVDPLIVKTSFNRTNLTYFVEEKRGTASDMRRVCAGLGESDSVVIYCLTRRSTEELALILKRQGKKAAFYHAAMPYEARRQVHHDIVAATVAFGMGIDKPDIRLVVHYGVPKTVEDYYQHTGRAGRDGAPSKCILLHTERDFSTLQFFTKDATGEHLRMLNQAREQMRQFVNTSECLRRVLLRHFGEELEGKAKGESCGGCGNCLRRERVRIAGGEVPTKDYTNEARLLVRAVRETDSAVGSSTVANVLIGSTSARTERYRRASSFGAGNARAKKWWTAFMRLARSLDIIVGVSRRLASGRTYEAIGLGSKGKLLAASSTAKLPPVALPPFMLDVEPTAKRAQLAQLRAVKPSNDSIAELENLLIGLRRRLAAQHRLPPYQVFGADTLVDLTWFRPTSEEGLRNMDGMTAAKCSKFGAVIRRYIKSCASRLRLATDIVKRHASLRYFGVKTAVAPAERALYEQLTGESKVTVEQAATQRQLSPSTVLSMFANAVHHGLPFDEERLGVTQAIKDAVMPQLHAVRARTPSHEAVPPQAVLASIGGTTSLSEGMVKLVMVVAELAEGDGAPVSPPRTQASSVYGAVSQIVPASQDSWVESPARGGLAITAPNPSNGVGAGSGQGNGLHPPLRPGIVPLRRHPPSASPQQRPSQAPQLTRVSSSPALPTKRLQDHPSPAVSSPALPRGRLQAPSSGSVHPPSSTTAGRLRASSSAPPATAAQPAPKRKRTLPWATANAPSSGRVLPWSKQATQGKQRKRVLPWQAQSAAGTPPKRARNGLLVGRQLRRQRRSAAPIRRPTATLPARYASTTAPHASPATPPQRAPTPSPLQSTSRPPPPQPPSRPSLTPSSSKPSKPSPLQSASGSRQAASQPQRAAPTPVTRDSVLKRIRDHGPVTTEALVAWAGSGPRTKQAVCAHVLALHSDFFIYKNAEGGWETL